MTIRFETVIDSETLYLPLLKTMLGRRVEILVREKELPVVTPAPGEWSAVEAAVRDLDDYDADAYRAVRERERERSNGAQPHP